MPLRDHFHGPLAKRTSWEGFHGQWPAMIVLALGPKLPPQYVAEPRVHLGSYAEIDVATFEKDSSDYDSPSQPVSNGDGAATAVWSPSTPTLAVEVDLPDLAKYEVRVYDAESGQRLVAAIEIVSPANKDRPEHRRAFVAKCAALLQQQVALTIIDLVTTRKFNLYRDLLDMIGEVDPVVQADPSPLYVVACRETKTANAWLLESWFHGLAVERRLPTVPIWLTDDLFIPLDLEDSYEQTCRALRIP